MTPSWEIRQGHVLEVLRSMPGESVQCVVTSPPYWSLRDYTLEPQVWGDWRGSLGLEPTPDLYVEHIVEVFREVRRVLRKDGTLWLNLGDTYASKARGSDLGWDKSRLTNPGTVQKMQAASLRTLGERHRGKSVGLKEKDLVGIPWRVAFALQADGWWLRSDVVEDVRLYCPCGCGFELEEERIAPDRDLVWSKPNPMPESVTDRPSRSHEYIFLLTKSARYFYDADAVREPDTGQDHRRGLTEPVYGHVPGNGPHMGLRTVPGRNGTGRNLRSVWTIATEPFPEAHFATFPKRLVVPCVKAGTSEKGCCSQCGVPWERVVEVSGGLIGRSWHGHAADMEEGNRPGFADHRRALADAWEKGGYRRKDRGFQAGCVHEALAVPCTVFDPFAGSGTVGVVALRLGRSFIGIELSAEYAAMARRRIEEDAPLFNVQEAAT